MLTDSLCFDFFTHQIISLILWLATRTIAMIYYGFRWFVLTCLMPNHKGRFELGKYEGLHNRVFLTHLPNCHYKVFFKRILIEMCMKFQERIWSNLWKQQQLSNTRYSQPETISNHFSCLLFFRSGKIKV
jgi:hypothetical protein